jgi:hypothetical protein
MMKLLFILLFFSCALQAMLIPIFNDDYVGPVVASKTPPSLFSLTMRAIARDRQNFSLEILNSLPKELGIPILEIRNREF